MIMGINRKYLKPVAATSALLVLLMFMPFVKMDGEGLAVIKLLPLLTDGGLGGIKMILGVAAFIVAPAIICLAAVLNLIKLNKPAAYIHLCVSVVYTFVISASVIVLKEVVDNFGGFQGDFYIKNLSVGFWLSLVIGFMNLHFSMKVLKIHPGYIALVLMSIVWLFPVFYLVMSAVRTNGGFYVSSIIPKEVGFKNYINVITDTSKFHYMNWYKNTLIVAVCACILTTFIVLSTAYVISRIKFVQRKLLMNLLLVLGMFPGFMSMIAVYYILKGMGLEQSLAALVIVYSAGASLSYYVAKGFFDTIPRALDEAAYIDGATKWDVFTKITIPLSKPIIIYTVLTSFMGPWADYIFASVILGDKTKYYTVAIGLFQMISRDNIEKYFTQFAAGATLIAIPIAILFISLQKYYVEGLSGSVKG